MLCKSFFFMVRCSSFWSFPISSGTEVRCVLVNLSHLRLVMSSTASGNLSPSRLFIVRSMPRIKGNTPVPAISVQISLSPSFICFYVVSFSTTIFYFTFAFCSTRSGASQILTVSPWSLFLRRFIITNCCLRKCPLLAFTIAQSKASSD